LRFLTEAASDEVSARRVLLLFAVSLIVVGLGGFVAVTLGSGDDSPAATSQGPTPATTTIVGGITMVREMGPALDETIAPYLKARATQLAKASGDRLAVVSFNRYVPESQARSLAGSAQVLHLLAALPGGAPAVVDGSIGPWLDSQFAATREERDMIRQMLPTVDDPQFRADYTNRVAELEKTLGSVDPGQPLVFGLVVKAPATALQTIARSGDVRLVDVGPSATAAQDAIFRGLRPEETTYANQPPNRPG
jgi:hypothetical protein